MAVHISNAQSVSVELLVMGIDLFSFAPGTSPEFGNRLQKSWVVLGKLFEETRQLIFRNESRVNLYNAILTDGLAGYDSV